MDINQFSKRNLFKIYSKGRSLTEVASTLSCSPNKVVYWMKKFKIKRRSHSDAAYIKQNPEGDPFKIKKTLSKEDMFLYGVGLGIYWGEGNKNPAIPSIRITNTDPDLIRIFIRFLRYIYGLSEKRFSYSIVSFNDIDPEEARSYWSKELKINPKKFGKITVVPAQGKGTYKRKSRFGVCTVQGNNSKLRKLVIVELDKLKRRYQSA